MRASVVVARGLSSCGSQALERRLSSHGTGAYLLCGMWDLPGPGLEPMSPALAGGVLTTAPPGKPGNDFLPLLISSSPHCPLLGFLALALPVSPIPHVKLLLFGRPGVISALLTGSWLK